MRVQPLICCPYCTRCASQPPPQPGTVQSRPRVCCPWPALRPQADLPAGHRLQRVRISLEHLPGHLRFGLSCHSAAHRNHHLHLVRVDAHRARRDDMHRIGCECVVVHAAHFFPAQRTSGPERSGQVPGGGARFAARLRPRGSGYSSQFGVRKGRPGQFGPGGLPHQSLVATTARGSCPALWHNSAVPSGLPTVPENHV